MGSARVSGILAAVRNTFVTDAGMAGRYSRILAGATRGVFFRRPALAGDGTRGADLAGVGLTAWRERCWGAGCQAARSAALVVGAGTGVAGRLVAGAGWAVRAPPGVGAGGLVPVAPAAGAGGVVGAGPVAGAGGLVRLGSAAGVGGAVRVARPEGAGPAVCARGVGAGDAVRRAASGFRATAGARVACRAAEWRCPGAAGSAPARLVAA
jgi:hypothetical protein